MDLSLAINVAGATLFALVGVGILAVSRGTGRGLLVGAAAATFGLAWVSQNFFPYSMLARLGLVSFAFLGTVACIALVRHLIQGTSRTARIWIGSLGMLVAIVWVVFSAMLILDGRLTAVRLGFLSIYGAFLFVLILLVGAIAVAFKEASHDREALASLGLAFGPFVTFLWAAFAASEGFGDPRFGMSHDLLLLVLGGATAAAIVPFILGDRENGPLSWSVFAALLAAGMAGIGLVVATGPTYSEDYGSFGVVRTVGAFFLVLAVVKYDLLKIPLPRFAVRRGTLATAALAVLLVVAEIAQNFLAAEYGLLMGGIAAGSLFFAAHPIQRALERNGTPMTAQAAAGQDAERSREAYLAAVRAVLSTGGTTPAQEDHLAEIAEHLGLGPREVLRLRREAERKPPS